MKYVDEYRRPAAVRALAGYLRRLAPERPVTIMEVCGTHTQQFYRFGLDTLLPAGIRLIAGPGCPVCVSTQEYIDASIAYARMKETAVLTFGDMVRVPGTRMSLAEARSQGAFVDIVYSPLEALDHARRHPLRRFVFLAVGFETTAAPIAISILQADREKLGNLYFHTGLKTIPAAMRRIIARKDPAIEGFLCPGHVSAIIGTKPYEALAAEEGVSCCVAGFEPLDIMQGLCYLLKRIVRRQPGVDNQYRRLVRGAGNPLAARALKKVFVASDAAWRGLGVIPASGLEIKERYAHLDAARSIPFAARRIRIPRKSACRCGEVVTGAVAPHECGLFGKRCTPAHPIGPCMVSHEGACNAHYRFRRRPA